MKGDAALRSEMETEKIHLGNPQSSQHATLHLEATRWVIELNGINLISDDL